MKFIWTLAVLVAQAQFAIATVIENYNFLQIPKKFSWELNNLFTMY